MRSSVVALACFLISLLWDDALALIAPGQRIGARMQQVGVFSINRRLSFSLAAERQGFVELVFTDSTVQRAKTVNSLTALSSDMTVSARTSPDTSKPATIQRHSAFQPRSSRRTATIMQARRAAASDSHDPRPKARTRGSSGSQQSAVAPLAEPPSPSSETTKPKPAKRKAAAAKAASVKKLAVASDERTGSDETASARGSSSSKSAGTSSKVSATTKSSSKSSSGGGSSSTISSSRKSSSSASTSKRRKTGSPDVATSSASSGAVGESDNGLGQVNEAALVAEVDLAQVTLEPIGYTCSLSDKPLDDKSTAAGNILPASKPAEFTIVLRKHPEDTVRSLEGVKNVWIIAHIKSEPPQLASENRALSLVAAEVLCVAEKSLTVTVLGASLPDGGRKDTILGIQTSFKHHVSIALPNCQHLGTPVLDLQPHVPVPAGAPGALTDSNDDAARWSAELAAAREALDAALKRADEAEEQVEQVTQEAEFEKAARAQAELQAMANRRSKLSSGSKSDSSGNDVDDGDADSTDDDSALRAKMEAAMSSSSDASSESEEDEDDEAFDTEASLLALEEQLKLAAEEKARADEEAEKKKFEDGMLLLKQRQKVSISGATGFDGGNINGEYVPNGEMYNGKPLYYKNGDASKWLRFVSAKKQWMVSTIEDTKAFNTKGMAESVDLNSEFPYQVKMWRLNQGLNSVTAASVKCIAILGTQPQLKSAVAPKTPKGLKDIKKANNKYISNAEKKECTLHVKNGELELTGAYVGEMRFGTAAGIGTVVWTDNDGSEVGWYNGGFVGGKMHGQGVFQWATGEKYEGEWHHDMMHGIGMMSRPDGSVEHVGRWSYDQPNYL